MAGDKACPAPVALFRRPRRSSNVYATIKRHPCKATAMHRATILFGLLTAAFIPDRVFALATEQLGNKPIGLSWDFGAKLLEAVNVEERVYWYEVNGNPTFFFKGGPKELNQAIRRFAAIPHDKREIVLLPRAGGDPNLRQETGHVRLVAARADGILLRRRVRSCRHPGGPHDLHQCAGAGGPGRRGAARRWIADLGSGDFKTRERASKELAALGPPVAKMLREALAGPATAEARDRLEKVLAGVTGAITVDVLELPKDVPVIGLEVLLERSRKELANKSPDVRGFAVSGLVNGLSPPEEVLPDLERLLKAETHEYPLRCAAGSVSHLGAAAKPLLPLLRRPPAVQRPERAERFSVRRGRHREGRAGTGPGPGW